jgi:hypothetical protein
VTLVEEIKLTDILLLVTVAVAPSESCGLPHCTCLMTGIWVFDSKGSVVTRLWAFQVAVRMKRPVNEPGIPS